MQKLAWDCAMTVLVAARRLPMISTGNPRKDAGLRDAQLQGIPPHKRCRNSPWTGDGDPSRTNRQTLHPPPIRPRLPIPVFGRKSFDAVADRQTISDAAVQ